MKGGGGSGMGMGMGVAARKQEKCQRTTTKMLTE